MREHFAYSTDISVGDYEDMEMREFYEVELKHRLKQAGCDNDDIEPTVWQMRTVLTDDGTVTVMSGRRSGWRAVHGF